MRKQLTGEPVAGELHTGFGGRGRREPFPTHILRCTAEIHHALKWTSTQLGEESCWIATGRRKFHLIPAITKRDYWSLNLVDHTHKAISRCCFEADRSPGVALRGHLLVSARLTLDLPEPSQPNVLGFFLGLVKA